MKIIIPGSKSKIHPANLIKHPGNSLVIGRPPVADLLWFTLVSPNHMNATGNSKNISTLKNIAAPPAL